MEALPASTEAAASPYEHPDSGKGIVDTAWARTVAGGEWFEDYRRLLRLSGLETEIRPVTANETFRFGDGRRVPCDTAYEIPVVIANTPMKVEVCVIPNSPLSLLLGRDFYKTYTPDILLKSRLLRLRDRQAPRVTSSNGRWSV